MSKLNIKKPTRYMASLNQDRFFKKIFSNLKIARAFLEDVLDVKIQEIEQLEKDKHYITDDSKYVEFDFRCKIDNGYVIIDMQQWYKADVIHRFYTYHTLNTALQLETLPLKTLSLDPETQKDIEVKDYRRIMPVVTLVWMVDDCLNHTDDLLSYSMTNEGVANFIGNDSLWLKKNINDLLIERNRILKKLRNTSKNLDFIPKNKLIFAFQKNIIRNTKHEKYFNWFKFAELSNNKSNKKTDFNKLKKDETFKENCLLMEKRLNNKGLTKKDLEYISTQSVRMKRIQKWMDDERDYIRSALEQDMIDEENKNKAIIEQLEQKAERVAEKAKKAAKKAKRAAEKAAKLAAEKAAKESDKKAKESEKKANKAAKLLSEVLNISIEEALLKIDNE